MECNGTLLFLQLYSFLLHYTQKRNHVREEQLANMVFIHTIDSGCICVITELCCMFHTDTVLSPWWDHLDMDITYTHSRNTVLNT